MIGDGQELRAGAMRRDIARRLALCNLDELRVIDRVLQRLEIGRERYGWLDLSKPRNWRKERCEERLDALVYDVAEELAAEDSERTYLHEAVRREIAAREQRHRAGSGVASGELALHGDVERGLRLEGELGAPGAEPS
jgi:hypothetical protein